MVGLAEDALESLGDLLQEAVSGDVAVIFIDPAKTVQIQRTDGDTVVVAVCGAEEMGEPFLDQKPVRQTGEPGRAATGEQVPTAGFDAQLRSARDRERRGTAVLGDRARKVKRYRKSKSNGQGPGGVIVGRCEECNDTEYIAPRRGNRESQAAKLLRSGSFEQPGLGRCRIAAVREDLRCEIRRSFRTQKDFLRCGPFAV